MCEHLHSTWVYPASDAGVLWVVFHSDGESVLSNSLSVKRSVHLHLTCLTEAKRKSSECIAILYITICLKAYYQCAA